MHQFLRATALILGVVGASCATAQAETAVFRDLSWGASESSVKASLGPTAANEQCDSRKARFGAAAGLACDSVVVTDYVVAQIPFRLSVGLDSKDRHMRAVSMMSKRELLGLPAERVEAARSEHIRLKALLTTRFGSSTHAQALQGKHSSLITASWMTPVSIVRLDSYARDEGALGGSVDHDITYSPRNAGDAGKL